MDLGERGDHCGVIGEVVSAHAQGELDGRLDAHTLLLGDLGA